MRKRILLVIGLTLTGMLAIIIIATRFIILNGFEDLQNDLLRQDVERFLFAVDDDLEGMDGSAGDWAEWDETYDFMEKPDASFTEKNLEGVGVFRNLRLHLILLADGSGKTVYRKAMDPDSGREIPFPEDLEPYLSGGLSRSAKGIALVSTGPLLLCIRPVLDSRGRGPARGALIIGRYLDRANIAKLERRTRLSIVLQSLSDPALPEDFRNALEHVSFRTPIVTQPLALATVAGYKVLKDIKGKDALMARVVMPRTIQYEGYKTLAYFSVSIIVIGIAFSLVLLAFLEKALISRVHALSSGVLRVGTGNNPSLRVPMKGTDEIAYLGAAINGMLTALEQSSADLRRSEARNEAFLAAVPDIIFRLAEDGTLVDFRWPAGSTLKPFPREIIGAHAGGIPFAVPRVTQEIVDGVLAAVVESSETGSPQVFPFTMEIHGAPGFFEARIFTGTEKETVIFVREITAEKKAQDAQRNEMLLKEIHHRVKNNIQVISSLLDLQARSAGDARTAMLLQESLNRLRSMSLIHEKLYRTGDQAGVMISEYIRDLASHLKTTLSRTADGVEIAVKAEDILLDIDIAVPCGLIVTELVSNALMHAFPGGRRGRIGIEVGADAGFLSLAVWDDGVGIPEGMDVSSAKTLGLRIVKILVDQLRGTLEWTGNGGTRFTARFPAAPAG